MSKINWKVAAMGGAAIGAAVGGFTLAGADDPDIQPVRDVDLQSYRDDVRSLSSPVEVTTTAPPVTAAPAPAAPSPASVASAASPMPPAAAQVPAPAPAYDSPDSAPSPVQPAPQASADSFSAASAAST